MKLFASVATSFAFLAALSNAAAVRDATSRALAACIPGTESVLNSTTVNGLEFTQATCQLDSSALTSRNVRAEDALANRNLNLCGAPCTTHCDRGTGGPNPNDCSALASAIQNNGGFVVYPGWTIYYWLGSCQAYITNTDSQDLYYCSDQSNLAGVINYVAWNCQASTGGGPYNGGSCRFYDNTGIGWVQVQTV